MKTSHPPPPRAGRQPKGRPKADYDQVLRACEAAAARIKSAGDELAACWTSLCHDIAAGVSSTDLLRKRAWCNVLELRLKEQVHALEDSRHGVDAVWDDMMISARARELLQRLVRKNASEKLDPQESLPLLIRAASALAAAHRRSAYVKK